VERTIIDYIMINKHHWDTVKNCKIYELASVKLFRSPLCPPVSGFFPSLIESALVHVGVTRVVSIDVY
jgi:hypothetical protein